MKFIDLFCGIGGFRAGLEERGHECVFSSEIDRSAQEAYLANFGERPSGDITEISEDSIPRHDLLCAGFPCQPFSISGKHRGIEDSRGQLFHDIVRIAKRHKPAIMLLENVKNILTIDGSRAIQAIRRAIEGAGYDMHHNVLNSSYFGLPQKRERVYFVCLRKGEGLEYRPPMPTNDQVFLEDILMDSSECQDLVVNRGDIVMTRKPDFYELKPIRVGYVNKAQQGERIYSVKGHAVTIAATTGGAGANTGLYLVDGEIRRLHQDECKLAMGFPANHAISPGRQGYKQLGNAVMPPMVGRVYDGISL